jgi:hypothetical protein
MTLTSARLIGRYNSTDPSCSAKVYFSYYAPSIRSETKHSERCYAFIFVYNGVRDLIISFDLRDWSDAFDSIGSVQGPYTTSLILCTLIIDVMVTPYIYILLSCHWPLPNPRLHQRLHLFAKNLHPTDKLIKRQHNPLNTLHRRNLIQQIRHLLRTTHKHPSIQIHDMS